MDRPSDPSPHDEKSATKARQDRARANFERMKQDGTALDLTAAHKRSFESGPGPHGGHGTADLRGGQ